MTTRRAIETLEEYGYTLFPIGSYMWRLTGHGENDIIGEYKLTQLASEVEVLID